ncbi:MAG: Ig-like domain-containing protein [Verrucomicrobia bacterium]|nr:Ig-like domain-containing protein [Verrucomicrobiota bacterium]
MTRPYNVYHFLGWAVLSASALPAAMAWEPLPARDVDTPGFTYTASPDDWRNINIYHVITDRFYDGDPLNNDDNPDGDTNPYGTISIHGGDFEGLEQKLDYLQMLGAKAVWISPVHLNVNGSFHGYAARDFTAIDPHWGTLDDLRNFVDAAHDRGIYVIIDVVQNHLGDLATSTDFGYPSFNSAGYNLRWRNASRRHAPPFDNLDYLHNYGNVDNWEDPEQAILGDFMGLDGIRTEHPTVRTNLITLFEALISATDCDGFRVDTARHVEMDFWEQFLPAMYDHAETLGKSNFFIYAEAWRGSDEEVGPFTATNRFNSSLYFPMRDTMESVFVWGQATYHLASRSANIGHYAENARYQLVNFLDNHDMPRLLSDGKLNRNQTALKPALTFLYTSRQVPCLYYGTEQGFNGGQDPYDREDMFDGEFEFDDSLGDNFNMTHDLFLHVRKLNLLREAYPALRLGSFSNRWENFDGPGIFVYTKILNTQTVVVAFNTSDQPQTPTWFGNGPQSTLTNGTVLIDVLGNLSNLIVGANMTLPGQIGLTLPAHASAILVPQQEQQTLPPTITACSPAHDEAEVLRDRAIVIDFDQPMNTAMVENAFSITPAAQGTFSWSNGDRRMTYQPQFSLQADVRYVIQIASNALSTASLSTGSGFESFFYTGASGGGDNQALGSYVMDGILDPGVPQLIFNRMILYAQFDPAVGALYLATYDAGEGNDHFIFLDDDPTDSTPEAFPSWNKIGTVASDGPFLADENDNDFIAWYQVNASANAKTGPNDGVMEGVINLYEQYGTNLQYIYIAVAPYQNPDGGSLIPDYLTPASTDLDQNIDADEYLKLNLVTGEIEGGSNTNAPPPGEVVLKQYIINGQLNDLELATLQRDGALPLYADFNGELLYVATADAGEGNDHFIFITDDPAVPANAPWAKRGSNQGLKHFLADENDSDFSGWFINDSMDLSHPAATTYNNGGYLEGTLNVIDVFGGIPDRLYLAVVPYETADGGALVSTYQNPPPVTTNEDLESDEYYVLEFSQFDTDGDGIPDIDEDINRNGVRDPGETGARIVDTDGDSLSDGDENLSGGDPLDPTVGTSLRQAAPPDQDHAATLQWMGFTSSTYQIFFASDLIHTPTWQPVNPAPTPGTGGVHTLYVTNATVEGFYRIQILPADN